MLYYKAKLEQLILAEEKTKDWLMFNENFDVPLYLSPHYIALNDFSNEEVLERSMSFIKMSLDYYGKYSNISVIQIHIWKIITEQRNATKITLKILYFLDESLFREVE